MNIFKLLNPFAKSEESPCHKYLQGMAKSDMVVKDLKLSLSPWTFTILGFALGFLSLALYLSERGKSEIIPYLVTVDKNGSVLTHGEVKPTYNYSHEILASFMCDYIEALYTVSHDQNYQVTLIQKAYAMTKLGSQAQEFADKLFKERADLEDKVPRTFVNIASIVSKSAHSFEVDFIVNEFAKGSTESTKVPYKAILTFKQDNFDFDDLDNLRLNPLKVFVSELNVHERLKVTDKA